MKSDIPDLILLVLTLLMLASCTIYQVKKHDAALSARFVEIMEARR